jgi:thiamine biosynthesis lipoprotein
MSSCARFECRRARPLLGTLVEISAAGKDASHAVEAGFAAVAAVSRLMSAHDPSSELSELNRRAHRDAMRVHPWTFEVLSLALQLNRDSQGAFDCTVGARQAQAGRLPTCGHALDLRASSADVELLEANTVRFRKLVQIDLGGIAKGYAVDRAVEAMRRAEVASGTVNAGGDLRVFGAHSRPIHVRLPEGGFLALGELSNGALATSITASEPPLGLPILEPRSGAPATPEAMAVVLADSCAVADALTKVVALRGPTSEPVLRRLGAEAFWRDSAGAWSAVGPMEH